MRTILYDPPEIEYLDGHPHAKVSPKTSHSFVQGAFVVLFRLLGFVFDVDEVFADSMRSENVDIAGIAW